MVPKIVAKGCSFKGASAYLLHDKDRAQSNERVDWTEVRNLSVDDPEVAWRIMAATALDRRRLKGLSGIKPTGTKSEQTVLHLVVSWPAEEKEELDREEMMRAATGALKALGAEDHQALFISHNDTEKPHVHILCNRTSPLDGRLLPSSNERLKLSRWAQAYEESRGKIFCPERVLNNESRDRGEFTRGRKNRSRRLVDEYKIVAGGKSDEKFNAHQRRQQDRNFALAERGREMAERHAHEQQSLERAFLERRDRLEQAKARTVFKSEKEIREIFKPFYAEMFRKHYKETRQFELREKSTAKYLQKVLSSLDMRSLVREKPADQTVGKTFELATSKGARLSELLEAQAREKRTLFREQRTMERTAKANIRARHKHLTEANSRLFLRKQSKLRTSQEMEIQELQSAWQQRTAERNKDWVLFVSQNSHSNDSMRSVGEPSAETSSDKQAEKIRQRKSKIKERFRKARDKDRER